MELKCEINFLQEELNKILLKEENRCKDEIVKLSQKLDKLIVKYYFETKKMDA